MTYKWLSSSSLPNLMLQNNYLFWIFLKGHKPRGYKNSGLQWRRIKSSLAKSHRVFKLRVYLSTDEVFKFLIAKTGWILSNDMIYSTMEGIVPSRCRLTTRHLGATLFKLRLYQICKSHVAASMHHDTWGLMQSHFCSFYWRPNSSYHNEPALGGYQLLLSNIQGIQDLIHYIKGFIARLVKHKALNLVDVGSSPMMEATL